MPPPDLHNLLSCMTRALHSEQRQAAVASGLLPVQWTMLTYLRDANRYSNTPQALADYLAMTKGTVSQSLKLLESQGLISRHPDTADRRVVRLSLTPEGFTRLAGNANSNWQAAIAELPAAERQLAEATLASVLRHWQHRRGGRTFGVCHSCRHFIPGKSEHQCGLTGEALSADDSQGICREHEQP